MNHFEASKAMKRLPAQFFAKLVQRAQQLTSKGYDVINLGQGSPDLPPAERIVRALQEGVQNPINHKYPPFHGFPYFKEAVAKFYEKEYGVELDPNHEVALMFGSKVGLFEVSQCLLNPGDVALLPNPGYPDYLSGISMANAEPVFMPLIAKNNYLPDYAQIDEASLRRAKLLFLNYPNNPTAAVATPEFFTETIDVAKANDICVVHDFAYGAIGFDGEKPLSFLSVPGAKDVGIELYSLSKTFNMAGWRVAFAVGNASVIAHINELQSHLFTSLFGAIQEAATEAITGDLTHVHELVATYERRRDRLVESLRKIGWRVEAPKGTFFAWFKVPSSYTSASFASLLLEKAHIVVAPGDGFGSLGEGYVRIGLLDTETRLLEAVERIRSLGITFD